MLLGIDLGTSALKAVLATTDGEIRAAAEAPLATQRPSPGWSEQAPEAWWRAACAAIRALGPSDVRAIGLSGQMHALVALDKARRPLRPAILWNDARAEAEAAAQPLDPMRLGGRPSASFPAAKLPWLAAHEAGAHGRIHALLGAKDWLGLRLHGELMTDASEAAGTLWLDQARRDWCAAALCASGARPEWLPKVREATEIAGTLTEDAAEALDLKPGIPVIAGAGDAAAGAAAMGAVEEGTGLISLGTSAQVLIASERYHPQDAALQSFAHALPGRWYRMAALLNGARPLSWFAGITGAPIETLLAEAEGETAPPLFLPYLAGERSPAPDPYIRAGFQGLSDGATRGAMMRAVAEGVAFSLAEGIEAVGAGARPLPLVGGGARSPFMAQLIADASGRALEIPDGAEAGAALGAALLAGIGIGALRREDLRPPRAARRVSPRPDPALAERRARFHALRDAVSPLTRP